MPFDENVFDWNDRPEGNKHNPEILNAAIAPLMACISSIIDSEEVCAKCFILNLVMNIIRYAVSTFNISYEDFLEQLNTYIEYAKEAEEQINGGKENDRH